MLAALRGSTLLRQAAPAAMAPARARLSSPLRRREAGKFLVVGFGDDAFGLVPHDDPHLFMLLLKQLLLFVLSFLDIGCEVFFAFLISLSLPPFFNFFSSMMLNSKKRKDVAAVPKAWNTHSALHVSRFKDQWHRSWWHGVLGAVAAHIMAQFPPCTDTVSLVSTSTPDAESQNSKHVIVSHAMDISTSFQWA